MSEMNGHRMNGLPFGWRFAKLGEVAQYLNGRAFKPVEWKQKGKPIIRIQNLNNPDANYNYSDETFDERFKVRNGDLLFAWSASLGAFIWRGEEAWLNQHIFKVLPKESTDKKYLFYLLDKIVHELYAKAHGSGMVHVTKGKFEGTEVPLPPLKEQQQIVSKIEELFSELDKSIEQLKITQQQLKVYRQSVLKWAFEGKLTNKNVKDGKLPEHWRITKLLEVTTKVFDGPFGSHLKSNDYVGDGVRVIRLENIGHLKFFDDYKTYVTDDKYSTIAKHTVYKGDIIFSSFIVDNIRVTILPENIEKAINKADCFCIRTSDSIINRKFLVYYLSTREVYKQLEDEVHGATRPRINTTQLKNVLIPLCSIDQQKEIVEEIESRLSVADKLEETITNSVQQAEALRQSILKKAFEGRICSVNTQ